MTEETRQARGPHGRPSYEGEIWGGLSKGIDALVNPGDLPETTDLIELLGDPKARDYLMGELLTMTQVKEGHVGSVSAELAHIAFWNDRAAALRMVRWLQLRPAIKGERANMILKMVMGAQAKLNIPTTMQRIRQRVIPGQARPDDRNPADME